jgi:hypothetical protein
MIRRINYTGRKRLKREDTQFFLDTDRNGFSIFNAALNLDEYGLPSDASVFVEAYRQTIWMRFDYGTIGNCRAPADRRLTEFDSTEGVLFRVRITSAETARGKILAEADQIPLQVTQQTDENRIPLLPVIPKELSGQVSRIDFEDYPRLEINTEAGDWRQLPLEPAFISMVLSYAVREILTRVLLIDGYDETEDPDDWRSKWLRFATLLPGVSDLPDDVNDKEQCDSWIDEAVSAFGRQHRIMERFHAFWNTEVEI